MGKKRKRTLVAEAEDTAAQLANDEIFTAILEESAKAENVETVELSKRNLKKKEKKEKRRREQERAQNNAIPVAVLDEAKDRMVQLENDITLEDVQGENTVAEKPNEPIPPESPDDAEGMDVDQSVPAVEQAVPLIEDVKPKKSARKLLKDVQKLPPIEDPDTSTAHLSILSKFKKYQALYSEFPMAAPEMEPLVIEEAIPVQGLQPLPQPAPAILPKYDPLSSLPSYLAQPTLVTDTSRIAFSDFKLSARLQSKLAAQLFTEAFPVQAAIIPLLLRKPSRAVPAQDLLVSASTGSGKTLSYLIPIIESLHSRIVTRIRALIIVPTRELVVQVQATAEALAAGSGLKIGTAIGTRAFNAEGEHLAGFNRGSRGVDIVVATPGRLVEHIRSTPGFTLSNLKWLIIDEADRLLGQSFQEWVDVVVGELEKPLTENNGNIRVYGQTKLDIGSLGLRLPENAGETVRKVVLSATMTRDVGKLSGLKLRRPRLVVVDETSSDLVQDTEELQEIQSLPPTLSEHYLAVSQSAKPLVLRTLLQQKKMDNGILIFTKSNESAARLGRLLELLSPSTNIAVCSGEMRKKEAAHNVVRFRKGDVAVLICTDLISRGMDISSALYVINYDAPRSVRDYIHRVGRTARAGNYGDAWNLIEDEEARWWWKAIGKGVKRREAVKRETLSELTDEDQEEYQTALAKLGSEVRGS